MFLPTLIFQKLPHGFPLCELSLPIIITARSSSLVNNVSVTQRSAYLLVIHMCHIHNIYERAKANLSSHSFEGMDSSGTHIICKIKNGFLVKVKVNGFFLTCSLFNHKCLTTWKGSIPAVYLNNCKDTVKNDSHFLQKQKQKLKLQKL